jgi:hypothetical protein
MTYYPVRLFRADKKLAEWLASRQGGKSYAKVSFIY